MASYVLSAIEVKELTDWPDPMVDEWLEAIKSINDLSEDLKSVRGSVTGLGISTDSGFVSAKTGTGIYTITFTIEKDNANYVILPSAGSQDSVCSWENKTTTGFGIRITTGGALADSDFNFMVKE